jgi:hypothetical protein
MTRNLTDPDGNGILEWQERVVDVDGDSLSIDLILDKVDGSNATNSNPSWLGYTTTTNTINTDETEVLVDITADTSGLSAGSTYTFEITADDGIATTTRTFQLEVFKPPTYQYGSVICCGRTGNIGRNNLTTDKDITTIGSELSSDVINTDQSTFINPDGKKVYGLKRNFGNDPKLTSYTLDTAWDLSTLSQNKTWTSGLSNPQDMYFKPNGKKMYILEGNSIIDQYTLGTAWDIGTISSDGKTLDVPQDMSRFFITPDGTNLYTIINGLTRWNLTTAWDISSAVEQNTKSNFNISLQNLFVTGDGKDLFMSDGSVTIYQYEFGTAHDVTTIDQAGKTQGDASSPAGAGIFFGP